MVRGVMRFVPIHHSGGSPSRRKWRRRWCSWRHASLNLAAARSLISMGRVICEANGAVGWREVPGKGLEFLAEISHVPL